MMISDSSGKAISTTPADVPIYASAACVDLGGPRHVTLLSFSPIGGSHCERDDQGVALDVRPSSHDPAIIIRSWDSPTVVPGLDRVILARRGAAILTPEELIGLAIGNDPAARIMVFEPRQAKDACDAPLVEKAD